MITTILPASRVPTVAKACVRGALLVAALFAVDSAFAGSKVYRCGNVFQDQPCTAGPAVLAVPDKPAIRESSPTPVDRKASGSTGTGDRLVVDPPRAVTIEARR